jgi:hypothetical protein
LSPAPALIVVTVLIGLLRVAAAAPTSAWASTMADPIVVEAETGGCPSRAEVIAALDVRLPGAAVRLPGAGLARRLLLLDRLADEAALRLRLFDARGTLALERRLQLGGADSRTRRAAGNCAALAEAAAQVVDRYLREIGYRPPVELGDSAERPVAAEAAAAPTPAAPAQQPPAPPAPAPAPPSKPTGATAETAIVVPLRPAPARRPGAGWLVMTSLVTGGRLGVGTGDRWSRAELLLALQLRWRWLALSAAAGASDETNVPIVGTEPGAQLSLRAFPVRVHVGPALLLPVGGWLLPVVGASLDGITFVSRGVPQPASGRRLDAALEGGVGYLRLFGHLGVGLRLAAGWALHPRDFDAGRPEPVFRTPGAYLRADLQLGFAVGKDSSSLVL